MYCGYCRTELKGNEQFCPKCGKKLPKINGNPSKKGHKKVIIISLLVVLMFSCIVGTLFLSRLGNKLVATDLEVKNSISLPEEDYIQITEPITEKLVYDTNSAIEVAEEIGEKLAFDNALNELTLKSRNEIDNISYYRLQENYQGIPVYGCMIVLVVDKNRIVRTANINVKDIPSNLNINYNVTEKEVLDGIKKSIQGKEIKILDFNNKKPLIYALVNVPVFAYQMTVEIEQEIYDVVIEADNKKILLCTPYCFTEMASVTGSDINHNFVSFSANQISEGSWILEDSERNMRVYDAENQKVLVHSNPLLVDSKGNKYELQGERGVDTNGNLVIIQDNPDSEMQNSLRVINENGNILDNKGHYELDLYGNKNEIGIVQEGTSFFDNGKAVTLFLNAKKTYDYYLQILKRTGFNGKNGSMSLVFDSKGETYSSDIAIDKFFGLLIFNKDCSFSYETIAHEYTHSVERSESAMIYEGESGAIMEAYSDLFGELVEDYADGKVDGSCDWNHHAKSEFGYNQSRNLKNPNESGNPCCVGDDTRKGIYKLVVKKDEVHHLSTIVSHAGYLMTIDADGRNNQCLTMVELANLWYQTMLTLPANCSFAVLRSNMESTAEIIGLSEHKRERISQAFDEVGIRKNEALSTSNNVLTNENNNFNYLQEYSNLIKKYEKEYGIAKVNTESEWFSYMTGLCFMKLVDFAQDGQEELLLVYEKNQEMGSDFFRTYQYEIWGIENNELTMLETGELFGTDGGVQHIYLTEIEGKSYLVTGAEDSFGHYYYHGYSNGKFGTVKEIVWEDDINGDYIYSIDGEQVSCEKAEAEQKKWFSNVTEYNLNESCDIVLKQNEETKKALYPYYEISEKNDTSNQLVVKTEEESGSNPYELFLKNKDYESICKTWYEGYTPSEYSIVDINDDGVDEIIIESDFDGIGFGCMSVFTYNTDSKDFEPIKFTDYYGDVYCDQYYVDISYSPKYHALVYATVNDGVCCRYNEFCTMKGNTISSDFSIQYLLMDDDEEEYSISRDGNNTVISKSEYDSYRNSIKNINWKSL